MVDISFLTFQQHNMKTDHSFCPTQFLPEKINIHKISVYVTKWNIFYQSRNQPYGGPEIITLQMTSPDSTYSISGIIFLPKYLPVDPEKFAIMISAERIVTH